MRNKMDNEFEENQRRGLGSEGGDSEKATSQNPRDVDTDTDMNLNSDFDDIEERM